MSLRSPLRTALVGIGILLPAVAAAQSIEASPPRLRYWLAAGPGIATANSGFGGFSFPDHRTALAGVASLRYRSLVVSARAASTGVGPARAWDVGLLAGLGSSPIHALSGSIGAGIGRQENTRGNTSIALPVELQLGPNDFLGATFMIRIGRLQ